MKEFLLGLGFCLIIILLFLFGTHYTKLDPRAGQNGLPSLFEEKKSQDTLKSLLAEADAASKSGKSSSDTNTAQAQASLATGEEIFNLSGANSCVYCHGVRRSFLSRTWATTVFL
jgi:mono/diheme cytochrome c family protein